MNLALTWRAFICKTNITLKSAKIKCNKSLNQTVLHLNYRCISLLEASRVKAVY